MRYSNLCAIALAFLLLAAVTACGGVLAPTPQSVPPTAAPTDTPLQIAEAPSPTPTERPSSTPEPTATPASTATPAATPTIEVTPTPTATNSPTPEPTATPTPVITPYPFSTAYSIDIGSYPSSVFSLTDTSVYLNNYVIDGLSSEVNNLNQNTIVERLSSYPGFDGPVIHVYVAGPAPSIDDMQRATINRERLQESQIEGPWAYEVSLQVLRAPDILVQRGWHRDPIISLASLLMHQPVRFRAAGGLQLISSGDGNYYVSVYRVNSNKSTTHGNEKVTFDIGVKQRIRVELFYDAENNNAPTIRGFLIKYTDQGPEYHYIDSMRLDDDIERIYGDITWVGAYVGVAVDGYELVAGEARILR